MLFIISFCLFLSTMLVTAKFPGCPFVVIVWVSLRRSTFYNFPNEVSSASPFSAFVSKGARGLYLTMKSQRLLHSVFRFFETAAFDSTLLSILTLSFYVSTSGRPNVIPKIGLVRLSAFYRTFTHLLSLEIEIKLALHYYLWNWNFFRCHCFRQKTNFQPLGTTSASQCC